MTRELGGAQGPENIRDTYAEGRSTAKLGNKDTGSREHQQGYPSLCRCKEGRMFGVCAGDKDSEASEGLGGCAGCAATPPLPAALNIWDSRTVKEGVKDGHSTLTVLGDRGQGDLTGQPGVTTGSQQTPCSKEGVAIDQRGTQALYRHQTGEILLSNRDELRSVNILCDQMAAARSSTREGSQGGSTRLGGATVGTQGL